MNINADFTKRVLMHSDEIEWVASPIAGVERRMLDRIGEEVARATTIVRYASGSQFSPHTHSGGEEFIVLQGVFQDEHGDYPAGSYIRNPPTSRHKPGSEEGCVIFVKLWQFDLEDRTQIKIDMNKMGTVAAADRPGVSIMPLFRDDRETVQVESWDAGADIAVEMPEGAELLVLEGSFEESGESLRQYSWLRLPQQSVLQAHAGSEGAKVWIKKRHLRVVEAPQPD